MLSQSPKKTQPLGRYSGPIFSPPYDRQGGEGLLSYYQGRKSVQYFPVIDAVETERTKITRIVSSHEFEFNHEKHRFQGAISWKSNPSQDLEWLILLHKFYYAVGLGMAFDDTKDFRYLQSWQALLLSWIDEVPLNYLPSDVMGRRVQNWIFAHYYFVTNNPYGGVDPLFYEKFLYSLHLQVSHLCDHLTPARNHRTLELCAIFLAAVVFPEFVQAANWLEFSRNELVKNIQTDLLPDGVHCELSTDYHHLVLKNYLWVRRLAHLNGIDVPPVMDDRIRKALKFAQYVHKPDGLIPAISDGDSRCFYDLLEQGYAIYQDEELRYVYSKGQSGMVPAERSKGFIDSGYYILRSGWGDTGERFEDERYLFFDCGPLGVGNHGHFDLLNIEMAAYGRSLIVDPGRYTYDETGEVNWRVRFRGTEYHNTVVIDGLNQTKYEAGKTKYKIKGPEPDRDLKAFMSQSGFDFLHGIAKSHEYPVTHERKIVFVSGEYWVIADLLSGNEPHHYDLLYHLSDEALGKISVAQDETSFRIHAPHLIMLQPRCGDTRLAIEDGFVSRTYGEKYSAPIIKFSCKAERQSFYTVLFPFKENPPEISVVMEPVYRGAQPYFPMQAIALRIGIKTSQRQFNDTVIFNHVPGMGAVQAGGLECVGSILCSRQLAEGTELFHARNYGS